MTDSVLIFPPGERILDASGNPVSGGTLLFYAAGTSTPLTVYSNSGLSVSLGSSVATDSGGYPSASATRTLIYTGTAAFKVVCQDALAATVWTHDNVRGAIDTSVFVTSASSTVSYTVSAVSTSGTWVVADVTGHVFSADPSSASFTRTLPTAASSTGVPFDIKHVGSANIVTLLAQGSDKIIMSGDDTARKALLLVNKGDSVRLISDGVNFQAFFNASQRGRPLLFAVEDLRTAPAGSPVTGGFYLLNGAPTGAFTTTTPACAANDVVMYDGQSNYAIFRPFTDCGWTVFDKATNTNYQYRDSGWVSAALTTTVAGIAPASGGGVVNFLRSDISWSHPITLATEAASTSGTAIDFTGIPAGVRRITLMLTGVSTNGVSALQAQIGPVAGVETAGYASSSSDGNGAGITSATGMLLNMSSTAANTYDGVLTFTLDVAASNKWVAFGVLGKSNGFPSFAAGTKSLAGTLERIRLTAVNGTDTFDAGSVNIAYE